MMRNRPKLKIALTAIFRTLNLVLVLKKKLSFASDLTRVCLQNLGFIYNLIYNKCEMSCQTNRSKNFSKLFF